MKFLALVSLLVGFGANAATLRCASGPDQVVYFTPGRLLLTANVAGLALTDVTLSMTGSSNLGSKDERAQGATSGNWVRFSLFGDPWCSYRLTLPTDFRSRAGSIPAFVDAFCEENVNANVRLNCSLR